MEFFLLLAFAGLSQGAIYTLIAHGFNVTYSTLKVVNFAHGSFLMIAVMLSLAAFRASLPLPLALGIGMCATAAMAGLLELVAIRPVLRQPGGMGWVVSTLGAAITLQSLAALIWGTQAMAFPAVVFDSTDYVAIAGTRLSLQLVMIFVVATAVMLLLEWVVRYTVWGKILRATSFDPDAALLKGIPVQAVVTASFVLSGGLAGLAGVLIAPISGIEPAFGLNLMIKGFVAAVIGGMGSSLGAFVGGMVVGLTELMVGGYFSSAWRDGVVFLLLIAMLMFRPRGLFGKRPEVKV